MKLSKQEVEKIAKLSRLDITDQEKEMFAGQISEVLEYVDSLKELDTENVATTAQVTGLENVYRVDEVSQFAEQENLIKQSADTEDNLIKTKSVF